MFDAQIQHAQFTLPRPTVHATHPFRNPRNHEMLLEYCKSRLESDDSSRIQRVERYSQIDRDVQAWMRLDDEDKKRQSEHERNGSNKATAVSLPLTWVHLDDMMTYYAQTFAPNRGMFYHTAAPDDSDTATQLVQLMNSHAIYGSYYRHLLRTIFNILKYNKAGLESEWDTDMGPQLTTNQDGSPGVEMVPIFSGNKISALDMYNFSYDPSVDPEDLYCKGEWCAKFEVVSHYSLKSRALEGEFYNCQKLLDEQPSHYTTKYYKSPPVEAKLDHDESNQSGGRVNWYAWLSDTNAMSVNNAFELVTMHIRINPNDFGLIPGPKANKDSRNRYEVWKIVIANGDTIVAVEWKNNIHNHLPAYFGVMNDDFMKDSTKSPAEIINPLQKFSSFLLNAHVEGTRKNLFGTTFYDPSSLDYDKIPSGEISGRVPIKPAGYGKDIRTMVYREQGTVDTKQTLQDLQGMLGIIDQFFPTQSLPSQIAGIDRAIDSQVAAVQQGTNRRQHKGARLLDDTMMRPMRYGLYYNIVQFQQDGATITDYFSGKESKVDLQQLKDSSLISLIGQGLKAIDRQQVAGAMRDLIFALIQSPALNQPQPDGTIIDILEMLSYWMSMLDVDVNMSQFRKPIPQQPAGGPVADPNAQPAAGVQPATDPAAIAGGPIYGA